MSAGPKYEWFWADGKNIKDPIGVSAPEYMDYLMEWTSDQFEDPKLFPPKDNIPFPSDFVPKIKVIFKRLFRVYAHVYFHHIDVIMREGAEEDLNTGFKHFYLFVKEFDLVDKRDMVPLEHLTKKIDDKTKQKEQEQRSLSKSRKKRPTNVVSGNKQEEEQEIEVEVTHPTTYYHDQDNEQELPEKKPSKKQTTMVELKVI